MGSISNMTEKEREELKAKGINDTEGSLNDADGYECDICHNKGYTASGSEYRGHWMIVTRDCKCLPVRKSIRRMQKSGLQNVIKDYTFDKFETTETWQKAIKSKAKEFLRNNEKWFFIGGQSGAGKTHICTAICREFLLAGKEVVYMLWRDDAPRLKATVNDPEYEDMINHFKKAEILYIDDLFKTGKTHDGTKQRPTAGDINLAFEIINYRCNEKLTTVISSECTINDLVDIDEALGGRIYKLSAPYAISLAPDRKRNYRLKGITEI